MDEIEEEEYTPLDRAIGDFLGIVKCLLIITDLAGLKKWIKQYAEEHLGIDEATDLSMDRGSIIDMILKNVKDKLMKDVMKNDLKDLKDIAAKVKRKVEIDFKHKGRLRIRT